MWQMCGAAGQGVHTRGDASYDCNPTPNTQPHPLVYILYMLNSKVLQAVKCCKCYVCGGDRSLSTHLDCSICAAEQTVESRKRNILTSLSSWGVPLSSFSCLVQLFENVFRLVLSVSCDNVVCI